MLSIVPCQRIRRTTEADRYRRLTPVLRDILHLHDLIASDSERQWQEMGGASGTGGKYGSLEMVESIKPGRPKFPFLEGVKSEKRLRRPALYPVLASFRQRDDLHLARPRETPVCGPRGNGALRADAAISHSKRGYFTLHILTWAFAASPVLTHGRRPEPPDLARSAGKRPPG